MSFREYNGLLYNCVPTQHKGLPVGLSWDAQHVYADSYYGMVVATYNIVLQSPNRRTLLLKRIRVLDLFDVPTSLGLFVTGHREDQTLLGVRGKSLRIKKQFFVRNSFGDYSTTTTKVLTFTEKSTCIGWTCMNDEHSMVE
jgi:hypothetical protein